MTESEDARRRIEAIWHLEAARVIGCVARMVRDVGLAEEFAQDAFVAALEAWPRSGVPDNPAAWLLTTARHRALDHLRHHRLAADKAGELGWMQDFQHELASEAAAARLEQRFDDPVGDDLLRLIFTACHPILAPEARSALTLRVMGGLTTAEIARAYLKPEATIAQRIVRAKRSLSAARIPFELPAAADLRPRLDSVLEVIYLIFNEGYAATSGADWMRPALGEEALRLGRILAGLMPSASEVQGLLALMELHASRFAARLTADGEPVLLQHQDRRRWDLLLIRRGLAALARAQSLAADQGGMGPYALQAAISACHARAARMEDTDWPRIVALYDALHQLHPSPVIGLNRAVAVSMAYGPAAALALVEELSGEARLGDYHLLPAVRGDLLQRLGRWGEAAAAFEQAAGLSRNAREQAFLTGRARTCREQG